MPRRRTRQEQQGGEPHGRQSGDGVEQDDFVSFQGAEGFRPPRDLWADQVVLDGVRLPFLKLPRNPED